MPWPFTRALDEDTLRCRRRVLGDDGPSTIRSTSNLGADFRALDMFEQARELDGEAVRRRHRTLGDDHPDTLRSATNLAADLAALGDTERCAALQAEFGLTP